MLDKKQKKQIVEVYINHLTTPPSEDGLFEVLTDRYWMINPETKGIVFWKTNIGSLAPQCNRQKKLVEKSPFFKGGDYEIVFLKTVYLKTKIEDFL